MGCGREERMKGENPFGRLIDLKGGDIGRKAVNKISEGQTASFTRLFRNHSNESHAKFCVLVWVSSTITEIRNRAQHFL